MTEPGSGQASTETLSHSVKRLRRLLRTLAIALSIGTVVLFPGVTGFFKFREVHNLAQHYAVGVANNLSRLANLNPQTWPLMEERIVSLFDPSWSALDILVVQAVDQDGKMVARTGTERQWLSASIIEPITDGARPIGRLIVQVGLGSVVGWSSLAAMGGLAIAFGLLLPLRFAPFDIAEDALRRLVEVRTDLEKQLRLVTAARDEATAAVTDMRLAQGRARHAEARLRNAVNASEDVWFIYDGDFRLILFSNNIAQLTTHPEDFEIGATYEEIMRRRYRHGLRPYGGKTEDEFVRERVQRQRAAQHESWSYQRNDGRWLLVRSHPLEDGGFANIYTDFTDLKTAEQRALQAEQRLYNAIDCMADGFRLWDADDRLILSNRVFKSQAIIPESTQVGRTFEEDIRGAISHGIVPGVKGREEEYVRQRVAQHRRADGTPFEVGRTDGRWFEARELRTDEGGVVQIRTEITEFKRHEKALQDARDVAERASRAKSEFLSRMSHDLRTPLNAVLGFSQVLLIEDGPDALSDRHREAVETIERTGQHLLEMVEDILDLARIENQAMQLTPDRVAIDDVVKQALSHTAAMASRHGAEIALRSDFTRLPHVVGDRKRVIQVMTNLLSNAIKYGGGGEIALDADTTDGFVHFKVIDRGPGIAPDRRAQLFEPFNRAGAEQTGTEGTGIGLTIAKGLVEQMGGSIGCESTVGTGSTFWFTLPVASAPVAADAAVEGETAVRSHSLRDAGPVTVLYVDDTAENRALVRRLLGRYVNVRYLEAESGEQGIEIARRERPDVILMDMRMPGMSGIEALRILRADAPTSDLAVIALTGAAMPHEADEINAAGFDGYLTKPFRINALLAQLVGTLERRIQNAASSSPAPSRGEG
jgi:hypothetical protein